MKNTNISLIIKYPKVNLKLLRLLTNLNQKQVAKALSKHTGNVIDVSTVSKHENSTRRLRRRELKGYSSLFNIPFLYLLTDFYNETDINDYYKRNPNRRPPTDYRFEEKRRKLLSK